MLNRLKISLILAPLALTMLIGVYVYALWSEERKRAAELPFDATGTLNRDLRKFHEKRGSFPEKLEDLEGVVWEKKDRSYLSGGRSMFYRNYFYIYSKVGSHRFTLWALPMGKERDETATLYSVGTPKLTRRWKGPAVPLKDVGQITLHPTASQLGVLGMVEQPMLVNRPQLRR